MRTIAILFALTIVAGAAPAAASSLDYLAPTLLLFTTALAALLLGCLIVGWRVFEMRTRMVPSSSASTRKPDPSSPRQLGRSARGSHAIAAAPYVERPDPRAIRRAS